MILNFLGNFKDAETFQDSVSPSVYQEANRNRYSKLGMSDTSYKQCILLVNIVFFKYIAPEKKRVLKLHTIIQIQNGLFLDAFCNFNRKVHYNNHFLECLLMSTNSISLVH